MFRDNGRGAAWRGGRTHTFRRYVCGHEMFEAASFAVRRATFRTASMMKRTTNKQYTIGTSNGLTTAFCFDTIVDALAYNTQNSTRHGMTHSNIVQAVSEIEMQLEGPRALHHLESIRNTYLVVICTGISLMQSCRVYAVLFYGDFIDIVMRGAGKHSQIL